MYDSVAQTEMKKKKKSMPIVNNYVQSATSPWPIETPAPPPCPGQTFR